MFLTARERGCTMKRRILVLMLAAMMLVMALATTSAVPALGQEPATPRCDWYEAGFDRSFNTDWWAYWCRYPGYGWYLIAWWSDPTGIIWVY
jgi:RES domain-containing protein